MEKKKALAGTSNNPKFKPDKTVVRALALGGSAGGLRPRVRGRQGRQNCPRPAHALRLEV